MIEKNNSIRQLIEFRLEKLNKLKELGIEPFPIIIIQRIKV